MNQSKATSMRIESVRIENFRVFKDANVKLNPYTCFVGPNGAGKSTVINALNIFFREKSSKGTEALVEEDFHKKDTKNPIRITATFTDLNDAAQEDFKHYFRQGKLVVTTEVVWSEKTGEAELKQFGHRLGMADFRPFFEAESDKKPVRDLKEIYVGIRAVHGDLPAPGTKDAMIEALQAYEANHADKCELIPSEDQFYGVSRGQNRLEKYIQWVYVPAVKDVSEEEFETRHSALGKLLERTVRAKTNFKDDVSALQAETLQRYQEILEKNQDALGAIGDSLASRLSNWAHPDVTLKLQWQGDSQKSVTISEPFAGIVAGEAGFSGSLSKFGHGLQRSYLLTILQELAACEGDDGPALILACEEPELYQHPPQIRHLASVFEELAKLGSQVLVCTHSPAFVSGEGFENVRMVRKDRGNSASSITHRTFQEISEVMTQARDGDVYIRSASGLLAKINQVLQPALNEIFFTPVLILVEGLEDFSYITAHMMLSGQGEEFRRLGCHIVPAGGKSSMMLPLAIARELGIPTYVVFDADGDVNENHRGMHEAENKILFRLAKVSSEPFPEKVVWADNLTVWPTSITKEIKQDFDPDVWQKARDEAQNHYGHTKGLEKNTLLVAKTLDVLNNANQRSALLTKLAERILLFARSHGPAAATSAENSKAADASTIASEVELEANPVKS